MTQETLKESIIQKFRSDLLHEERSALTIEKYIRDVRHFARFVGKKKLCKELVIEYKSCLMEQYAPSSVNSMLVAVNRFLKNIGRYDCVVKTLRIQQQGFRNKEQELTKEEYIRLLEAARKRKERWLFMLMQTLCATGIRVSELRFITVEAIQTGQATVSLKGKTRTVLLPTSLCRELKRYVRKQKIQSGSIFVTRSGKHLDRSNILHAMKSLSEEAGVDRKKIFPHNLRHLFACMFYRASRDISRLADLLGHSSINTTRIYVSVSGMEQRKQIDRLGLVMKTTA